MKTLTLEIPEGMNEDKARLAIAEALLEQGILSPDQAATIAGISRKEFLVAIGCMAVTVDPSVII